MNGLQLPEGVGLTALFAAYARAQETRRTDRLFADPLAEEFVVRALGVNAEGRSLPRLGPAREDDSSHLWNGLYSLFSARTGFYDSYLLDRVTADCRQIVLLGAGLDTRAFRLSLPVDTVVYEVDTPGVLTFKDKVLADVGAEAAIRRVPVETDLRDDWPRELLAAGFAPKTPTTWLAEGLLMYFQPAETDRFLDEIGKLSAPGSSLAGEYLTRRTRLTDIPISDDSDRAVATVFVSSDQGGPELWPPSEWLRAHGWTGDGPDLVDELNIAGRPVPELFNPHKPDALRLRLFSAALNPRDDRPGTANR